MADIEKQKINFMISKSIFCTFLIFLMLGIKNINSDELNYFIKTSGDRPYGIAFDNKGLMYMVTAPETGNGMLSKVTPDGKVTHIAVIEGNFIGPGIYIDNEDNIFIAAGDRLLNVSPEGKIKIIADGFSRCFDVKLDKDKNIYLADDLQNTIYKITSGKKDIFYKGDTTGSFVLTGIVIDCENENLYAREGNRILKFHLQTNITQDKPEVILDKAGMFYMYMDNNNNIYASTLNNVIKVDTGRNVQYLSQKALKTSIGLAAGGRGFDENSLYVAVEDGIIKLPMSK